MADPTAATTEGVWRRQSRDAMTNSGRDREREEGAGDSNEGGFLSLQIQGKWTDKEPNTAVSAFFPHRRCPMPSSSSSFPCPRH